jgi:phospholipid/cholesterol/gamma-HCH transport system substrate-binding protein
MLEPGAMVPPGESADLVSAMSSVAGNVDTLTTQGLLPLIDNLNHQVTALGDIINHDLKPLAANASQLMSVANDRVPMILKNAESASSNLEGASTRLTEVFNDKRIAELDGLLGDARGAVKSVDSVMQDLVKITGKGGDDLRVGIEEFRFTMENISRRSESIAENLDSASRNLQDFSRQLKQNPGLLLGGREQKDTEPPMREGSKP